MHKKPIIVVVPALVHELPGLAACDKKWTEDPKPLRWFSRAPDENRMVYIAKVGKTGKVVGYAVADHTAASSASITRLAVDPMYRRQGVGSALFYQLLAEKPEGVFFIKAKAKDTLLDVHLFLKALGFHCVRVAGDVYHFEYGVGAEC